MNEKQRKSMPRSPGRPKGVPNKTTTLLKEAILRAADEAGGSGGVVEYLTLQAHQNPAAFMGLLGKVLPMQVAHSGSVATAAPDLTGMDAAQAAAAYSAFVKLTDGSGGE